MKLTRSLVSWYTWSDLFVCSQSALSCFQSFSAYRAFVAWLKHWIQVIWNDFSVVVTWNIEWRVEHRAVVIRALRSRTSTREVHLLLNGSGAIGGICKSCPRWH